jgi:hypothetical protein
MNRMAARMCGVQGSGENRIFYAHQDAVLMQCGICLHEGYKRYLSITSDYDTLWEVYQTHFKAHHDHDWLREVRVPHC